MFDIKSLPKDPSDALLATITYSISIVKGGGATIGALRSNNHKIATDLTICAAIAKKSAIYIRDRELSELIIKNVSIADDDSLEEVKQNLETALNAMVAYQLDDHFVDQEAVEFFDRAELSEKDKNDIRQLMADARRMVDLSSTLVERQRKKVLYHISKIENELHKEKSVYQTCLAAAYDMSALAKQVGKDALPIAEAIEKARTVTEKKVSETLAIEKDEEKKMLPKPDDLKE